MPRWWKKFVDSIVGDIFPENFTCIACQAEMDHDSRYSLCDKCMDRLEFIGNKSCELCGAKIFADTKICIDCMANSRIIERNYSALVYSGEIKKIVHAYKYLGHKYLSKPLGNILYDKYVEVNNEIDADIIIPVPLNINRERERGFNQVTLMLKQFEKCRDIIDDKVLVRIKDTPQQMSLAKEKRRENVEGAFEIKDESAVKGANVLLVDDIYTTGATMDECARVLYRAGANNVCSMTLCNAHIERAVEDEVVDDDYLA